MIAGEPPPASQQLLIQQNRCPGSCGELERSVRRTVLVVYAAFSQAFILKTRLCGNLPQEPVTEGHYRIELVRIPHNRETLRAVGQRQYGCETALAGLVDNHQVKQPRFQREVRIGRQCRARRSKTREPMGSSGGLAPAQNVCAA